MSAVLTVDKPGRPPLDLSDVPMVRINRLKEIVGAVTSPIRIRMLHYLNNHQCATVGDMMKFLNTNPVTTSVYLGRLKRAGLVASKTDGQHRVYRITNKGRVLFRALRTIANAD